jgi:hypothetical protein
MYAADKSSQMAPFGVRVVYTAFSPLRSYLWAAFRNQIYRIVPSTNEISWMNQAWTSNGHNYRGVAVFQFNAVQPANANLTSACIPIGREMAWANTVQGLYSCGAVTP